MIHIQELKIAIIEDHVLVRTGIIESLIKINESIKYSDIYKIELYRSYLH
jgi:hypothetical protein